LRRLSKNGAGLRRPSKNGAGLRRFAFVAEQDIECARFAARQPAKLEERD
jgi:hypothetical protein